METDLTELKECSDSVDFFSLKGKRIPCKVVYVYDADTVRACFYLDGKLTKFTIRLTGIDTPERKVPKNDENRDAQIAAAMRARDFLIDQVTDINVDTWQKSRKLLLQQLQDNRKVIEVQCGEFDKYGRLLGELYSSSSAETSLNEMLIKEGHAMPYDGGKKIPFSAWPKATNNVS